MFTLMIYLAGHLAVLVTAIVIVRQLRREPNLAGRLHSCLELTSRPMRIEADEAELAEARTEQAAINRRADVIREELRDYVPLDDPPSTRLTYGLLTAIFAEAEAAVFFLLSAGVALLGLGQMAWAFVAPVLSAAWVLLLHTLLSWAIEDRHRPARTVRRAKLGAGLGSLAVVVGVWCVLSGRNLSDARVIETLASAGLLVLAGVLAVTSGFSSLVWTTLFEAERKQRDLARLERIQKGYTRHLDAIEKDLARFRTAQGPPSPDPPAASAPVPPNQPAAPGAGAPPESPAPLRVAAPGTPPPSGNGRPPLPASNASDASAGHTLIAALLAFGLMLPIGSRAQTTAVPPVVPINTRANASAGTPAVSIGRAGACEFMPDITPSVDHSALQGALSALAHDVPLIADALHCSVYRIVPFAGTLFQSVDEQAAPIRSTAGTDCRAPEPTTATAKAVRALYPKLADQDLKDQKAKCDVQRQELDRKATDERRAWLDQVSAQLEAVGSLKPRGPCTALPQAIQRALQRSQRVIVVSDGLPSCPPPRTRTLVPPDGFLLFVLVPPNDSIEVGSANALLDRLASLERDYPGSHALLTPEATRTFWGRLDVGK